MAYGVQSLRTSYESNANNCDRPDSYTSVEHSYTSVGVTTAEDPYTSIGDHYSNFGDYHYYSNPREPQCGSNRGDHGNTAI